MTHTEADTERKQLRKDATNSLFSLLKNSLTDLDYPIEFYCDGDRIEISNNCFNSHLLKAILPLLNFEDHLITFFPCKNIDRIKIDICIISEKYFTITEISPGNYIPGK